MYPSVDDRRRHGCVTIPSTAVINAPLEKEIFRGAKLTIAFAGATTFAAIFVEIVANIKPMSDSIVGANP